MPIVKTKAKVAITRKRLLLDNLIKESKKLIKPVGAKMVIPISGDDPKVDNLSWVIYNEFGTATKRRGDPRYGIPGKGEEYPITPSTPGVKALEIPRATLTDPNLIESRFDDISRVAGSESTFEIDDYIYLNSVSHPGVPPKRYIRDTLQESDFSTIKVQIKDTILAIGSQSERKIEKLSKILVKELNEIKESIANKIEALMPQRRFDGKLEGEQPATIFRRRVRVVKGGSEDE